MLPPSMCEFPLVESQSMHVRLINVLAFRVWMVVCFVCPYSMWPCDVLVTSGLDLSPRELLG